MAVFRNLRLLSKRITKRPLTRADIYSYCAEFIKTPPMIEGGKQFFENTVRYEGKPITLTEYYRKHLLAPALNTIANAATWQLQRTACIEAILEETHWRNLDYCIRHAKSDLGKGIILGKLDKIFPNSANEDRINIIFAFYMMNLSAQAALGSTCFGIDGQKELELKLCNRYQRDIIMIDVHVMDYIDQNHMDDPDTAYRIAEWRENRLGKVTQRMFNLLIGMKEQIANDTFDVTRFQHMSDALEQDREDLVKEMARSL